MPAETYFKKQMPMAPLLPLPYPYPTSTHKTFTRPSTQGNLEFHRKALTGLQDL